VDAAEVIVHVVGAIIALWFSTFFENAFVSRVKRRMLIRMVEVWRSTKLVETNAGSGSPAIAADVTPCIRRAVAPFGRGALAGIEENRARLGDVQRSLAFRLARS